VRRSLPLLLLLVVSLCGCGARDAVVKRPTPTPPCPAGSAPVSVRDVVGDPARGWDLWEGDKKQLRKFALGFRDRIGDAWRGYRAAVLIRDGQEYGTAVVVINAKEQTGGDDLIQGMEQAAEQAKRPLQDITLAGREGRLVHAIDDSYVAMAPSHQCSVLVLIALKKQDLVDAAATLPEE
jgi:hypothetical protein